MRRASIAAALLCAAAGAFWLRRGGTAAQWVERGRRLPVPVLGRANRVAKASPLAPLQLEERVLEELELAGDSTVTALAEGSGGLYLGTFDEGALAIDKSGRWHRIAGDARVNDLATGPAGELYLATNGGAFVKQGKPVRLLARGAFSAVAFVQGAAWFASRQGLWRAEGDALVAERTASPDAPTVLGACGRALCIGASDGLWLLEAGRAAHRSSASGDLPEETVTALARGGGALWAGTFQGGLVRFAGDARTAAAQQLTSLPDGRIQPHALVADGDSLYAGTPRGLMVVRGGRAGLIEGEPVTALLRAARGGLWVGTRGAVRRIELVERSALAQVTP